MQPDLEELELNMEDNEDVDGGHKDLGKLQCSLDYDFQKGEVGYKRQIVWSWIELW